MILTAAQKAFFEENGFVAVDNLFTAEEAAAVGQRLDDIVLGRIEISKRHLFIYDPVKYKGPTGGPLVESVQLPAEHDEVFRSMAEHPRLIALMQDLIGPTVTKYTDQVIMKNPQIGIETFFHQDGYYWRNAAPRTVNCWIALDDASLENGCLRFMPSSFKWGLQEHESYYDEPALHSGVTGQSFPRLRIPLEKVDRSKEISVPVKAGGCVAFTTLTWHASHPNRSPIRRRAYAVAYQERV